jgi:TRAP transporter TAXI family solute receptor
VLKRKAVFVVICIAMVMVLALAGCGQKTPAPGPGPAPPGPEKIDKVAPTSMVIGSASVGGTYYLYAGAWASLAQEALGIPVSVEQTDGPNHNLILIQDGDLYLGMTTMGPAYEAWEGLEDWTGGIEHKNIRSLFPMYNTYFHWIADAGKGINSLRDMEGKRVGSGPRAGTIGTFGQRFFDLLGINPREVVYGGIGDLVENQGDGLLDANGFAAGIPVSAFKQYEVTKGPQNVVFIGVDGADREAIKAKYPYFSDAVIPKGVYDALTADLQTIGVWNIAIASKFLDDDYVYKMVKAVLENNAAMKAGHAAAAETLIENFKHMDIIPLHPGAIRYYKEKGLTIPAHLIPPEYAD